MEFLETSIKGKRIYIVKDHRTSLLCWKRAYDSHRITRNSLLIHVDAHADFKSKEEHKDIAKTIPAMSEEETADFITTLDTDNSEFIVPAMLAQIVGDAVFIGWRHGDDYGEHHKETKESTEQRTFESDGVTHKFFYCKTHSLSNIFSFDSYLGVNSQHHDVTEVYNDATSTILDIDLDFFCYKNEQVYAKNPKDIEEQLMSTSFSKLFDKAGIVTIALEPECCGGKQQCLQVLELLNTHFFKKHGIDAYNAIKTFMEK